MRRRDFIKVIVGTAAAWPLVTRAQQPERARRIAVLLNFAEDDRQAQAENLAFLQGLQQLGWTDGRNIRIGYSLDRGRSGPRCQLCGGIGRA